MPKEMIDRKEEKHAGSFVAYIVKTFSARVLLDLSWTSKYLKRNL